MTSRKRSKPSRERSTAPRKESRSRLSVYWAMVALFGLSGACGLVYQVIWSRLTVLVFGSTTHAIATVLGVFFLGLALGSFLGGRLLERQRHPLKLYGYLEIGIGLYAVLFYPLLKATQGLHHAVFPLLFETPALLIAARILLATLLLLLPTVLMGATVPVVGDYLTRSPRHVGRDFGLVFAFNTFGAATGSFFSAFFLIPALGLQITCWLAAGANLLIGLASLYLSRREPDHADALSATDKPGTGPLPAVSSRQAYAALVAFALTGFLGLVYEVAWSRALILVFGTSVYAFATMLTTYLVGLACGSIVMGRLVDRFRFPLRAFIWVQVAVGLSVFFSTVAIGRLPEMFLAQFSVDTPWRSVMLLEFAICFAIMFVPAFGSGMLFPLVARIFMAQRQFRIGRTIADSYAVNTLGCIAGSFAAGFVLIPLAGIEKTLLLGAALNLLVAGGLVLFVDAWPLPRRLTAGAALLAVAVAGVPLLKSWEPLAMNSGVYIYGGPLARLDEGIDTFVEDNTLLFYREGPSATVAVLESSQGRFLRVNGKTDGGAVSSERSDDYTQSFLGMLPLLYAPAAEQGLVIGLGTGMTLEGALASPRLKLDCIEISPAVAEASRYFDEANGRVLESPRVSLRLLDGRTWLDAMPNNYDLIISEPSHPWQTGNANLFTRDFMEASARRLTPGGVFCQWLPYYQMDPEHFQTLIHTVHHSYPYVHVWVVYTDAIVIGSQQPLELDWPALQRLVEQPAYARMLRKLGVQSLPELLGFFYLDTPAVERFIAGIDQVNTDNHPIIEYAAPKYLLRRQSGETFYTLLQEALRARIPVNDYVAPVNLERSRVASRQKYFAAWGVPESVYALMMRNY